ncbi:integrin beta chain VWA domain-containing protein [Phthorimaea operculella]|nr:integrin beta chain VWA domain-containing protein [Phthorimaea operculella]
MLWFKVLFVISVWSSTVCEKCELFETCGKCIGNDLHCAWCPDNNHTGSRCISSRGIKENWCLKPYNPQISTEEEQIKGNQFIPSKITIKARPGDEVSFDITYKPASDYPIDVYYLFDNSYTMKQYRDELVQQAQKIYDTLKAESNNVRFGAGSFVEKLALPFARETSTELNTFNNHLSLTSNISVFVDTVKNIKSENNLDDPECGLDALMQVMVCDDKIGWRPGARRLIILSTDDTYHSAGDGRAVGAYMQNDMKCHLIDSSNPNVIHTYDKKASLFYDYPSVSQINYMASKRNMFLFFVAKQKVAREYKALSKAIFGAHFVELAPSLSGGNDLAKIIKEHYTSLMRSLEISTPVIPPHLQLNLNPDCTKKNEQCSIPHHGSTSFKAALKVKRCPLDNKFKHSFTIKSAGLADEVTVEVEVLCECDCERNGEKKSPKCSLNEKSHGTFQCGVCKCEDGWYGKTCQCAGDSTEKDDLRKCTPPSTTGAKICSDRGICRCGKCECWEGYDDLDQCQRRTDDCPTHNQRPCAGHGTCVRGNCSCVAGWTGAKCECPLDKGVCLGANGQECSGHGYCDCDKCVCQNDKKIYEGKYCEKCDTCNDERCAQLKEYVHCMYDGEKVGDKIFCDNKYGIKTNITVEIKNQTELDEWTEVLPCPGIILPDGSQIIFKFLDGNNFTYVMIQKEKMLPPETNIWIPIGIAVGSILLIGILTLIAWKVLVDMHDAREYRKFVDEAKKSGFEVTQNPLYKPAAVSINNPAYSG